jgi:hypothetical protein
VAYYDGQKFPWEHPELIAVGEERKDYLEFIDPDDLDDEVEERGLVHQLRTVVARIGEQVLQPRPALADGSEDRLRACAVRYIG